MNNETRTIPRTERTNNIMHDFINVKIGAWNAGGLHGKLADILQFIKEHDMDWVFISETQWEVKNRDPKGAVSSQLGIKTNPFTRANYGTMIFTNQDKPNRIFEILDIGEAGSYQIFRWEGALFMGVYVKPGHEEGLTNSWIDIFNKLLTFKRSPNELVIIMGDFNMRTGRLMGDKSTNARGRIFGEWLRSNNFSFMPIGPSREGLKYTFRNTAGYSIVDYILIQGETNRWTSEGVQCHYHELRSDHCLVSIKLNFIPSGQVQTPISFHRWKLHKFEDEETRERYNTRFINIHSRRLELMIENMTSESQEGIDLIEENIIEAIKENARVVIGESRTTKGETRLKSRKLDELNFVCSRISGVIDALKMHNHDRSEILRAMEELKNEREAAKAEARSCMLFEWNRWVGSIEFKPGHLIMKQLCASKNSRTRARGNMLKTDSDSMDRYRTFFEGQFNNNCTGSEPFRKDNFTKPPPNQVEYFSEAGIEEVTRFLSSGRAGGRTGIRNELIKYCSEGISKTLYLFFNRCAQWGFVPSSWKVARIVPIPKKERASEISDHRPISLTEILRKLFERLLLPYVNGYIEPKMDIAQGGFRSNRGTIESIASLNETILQFRKKFRGRNPVIAFLDIQKAYDSVDWNILFSKLRDDYEMPPDVNWLLIELFTSTRSTIAINGVESDTLTHRAGVLQGSVLSPILYSSYINTLAKYSREAIMNYRIDENIDWQTTFMYADDVAIVARNDEEMAAALAGCERNSIDTHYKFNVRKCEVMNTQSNHKIYDNDVPNCVSFKYLGVMMDKEGIDWRAHLGRLQDKTLKMINFFRSIGYNMNGFRERTRLQIYKTFIRPLCEYGLCMMPKNGDRFKLIDRVQNQALCAMFSVSRNTSTAALEVINNLTNTQQRWNELSFRWKRRLNGRDDKHMVTIAKGNTRKFLIRKSCFAHIKKHIYDEDWERYNREMEEEGKIGSVKNFILKKRREYLISRRFETTHLKEFPINENCKPRQLYQLSKLNRRSARLNVLWMLGKITGAPRRCIKCGLEEASYKHFMRCAGVEDIDIKIRDGYWNTVSNYVERMLRIAEGLGGTLAMSLDAG